MAIRKNKKRIDPRYFLHETTYRDELEEGTLSELEGFTQQAASPPAAIFFRRILGDDFNAHFGRAGGFTTTWNYDDARSEKDKSSVTMKGVTKTQEDARSILQGAGGMKKLQQAVEKFNQDSGANLKVGVHMGDHDPNFQRTGVRTDEQEVYVTISSEG